MLVSQMLSPVALRNSTKHAVHYLKFHITYKEFWETSNRFSYYLQKEIGHGNRVGVWMSNCPHYAYTFVALSNTKNCTVPLNPLASSQETLFKIKHASINVILCSSDRHKQLKEFLQQNGFGSLKVIEMESKRCAEYDPSYTPPSSHVPNEKDEILLFYTPGTTGKYKGCLFDHKAVCNALTGLKTAYKILPTDVFFTQMNYSSAFHFIHFLMAPLAAGASVFISDQVEPKELLPLITQNKVTRMAPKLSSLPELLIASHKEKLPIPTIKHMVVYGTSVPKLAWDLMNKVSKVGVINVYGMTEYLGAIAMGTPDVLGDPKKPTRIGPPIVGTKIRVVDDNNDEIDKKKPQKGQLLVMGPSLMTKYLDLPEEQKQTIRGTWLFTGDSVEINENIVTFLDRKADLVVLDGGKQISPKEIEALLKPVPVLTEVAYIGVKTQTRKPTRILVLVKKEGASVTEKQVLDFLAKKLTKDKMPAAIFFVDSIPKTISGALNRAKLRSQYDGAI